MKTPSILQTVTRMEGVGMLHHLQQQQQHLEGRPLQPSEGPCPARYWGQQGLGPRLQVERQQQRLHSCPQHSQAGGLCQAAY